ncbi:MAG TPA: zinc ribbon domain-containing protein [Pseudonocardiaceae bacterium]|nr:zinc ribbon domain-containing protein [Pseudonocardiaceae bacterium]
MPAQPPPALPSVAPPPPPPSLPAVSSQAAALVAPISETRPKPPAPTQPDVVVPTEQAPKQRSFLGTLPPTRKLQPGDKVCGDCGEGNNPNRKFCSRCGASLDEAAIVKAKWWRKLLPRKRNRVVEAGMRPGRRGMRGGRGGGSPVMRAIGTTIRTVMKIGGVVVLVGGIVYASYAPFRTWTNNEVNTIEQKVLGKVHPQLTQIHAFSTKALAEVSGHPGAMVDDGFTNTYWEAADNVTEQQPLLTLTFDHAVTIQRIILHSGSSDNFQSVDRPATLHLVYNTGQVEDITTKDTPDGQTLTVNHGADVTSMTIQVTGVYRTAGATQMAITEIEFFGKD